MARNDAFFGAVDDGLALDEFEVGLVEGGGVLQVLGSKILDVDGEQVEFQPQLLGGVFELESGGAGRGRRSQHGQYGHQILGDGFGTVDHLTQVGTGLQRHAPNLHDAFADEVFDGSILDVSDN